MGSAGAAPACPIGQGASAEVEQAAVDRRDPVADPNRRAVARCARLLRPLALDLWPVQRAGILAALQGCTDAAGKIGWTVSMNSTIVRPHQHAAGAHRDGHLQKEPPGGVHGEPADHALGRSHGGLTTKTHLPCEQGSKLLAAVGDCLPCRMYGQGMR